MKYPLCFTIILLLFLSCKKGDIETPIRKVSLKGQLKSMKVNEYSTGRLEQIYIFDYIQGALQSVQLNGTKILEWKSEQKDSLKLRGYQLDEESHVVQPYEMHIQADAASFIQSIIQLPGDMNPDFKELLSVQKEGSILKSIKAAAYFFNTPQVPGLASIITSEQFGFGTESIDLFMHTNYLMTTYPFTPDTKIDTVHVEFGDKKNNVPLPVQSLTSLIPWTLDLGFSSNIISYFLHLSGYQIFHNFAELPEIVEVNGEVLYTIEYVQNSDGQVVRMVYLYKGDKAGEVEFEYFYE